MPRKISEERMCNKHAHKEMIDLPLFGGIDPSIEKHSGHRPHLEKVVWYFCDHTEEREKGSDYAA
jgi:hypothetical protein